MNTLWLDLRVALRGLRQRPLLATTAILTLAVAIGSATAVFGVVHGVLLKPLPIREQDQVVVLRKQPLSTPDALLPVAVADIEAYAEVTRTLESVAGVQYDGPSRITLRDQDRVIPAALSAVSGDFFRVLDAPALVGRPINREDDVPGGPSVVVISYSFWRREFGADPGVVGHVLQGAASGRPLTIVGVMPPGLEFPSATDLWIPIQTITLAKVIELGVDLNAPCADLYSHATALHHAVSSGSLEAVKVLVEAGASLDTKDSVYGGTPLG